MILAFFEDAGYRALKPLTLTTPVYFLKAGPLRVFQVWARLLEVDRVALFTRREVGGLVNWIANVQEGLGCEVCPEDLDDEVLALNSALLPLAGAVEEVKRIKELRENVLAHKGGRVLAVKVSAPYANTLAEVLRGEVQPELFYTLFETLRVIELPQLPDVTGPEDVLARLDELLSLSIKLAGEVERGDVEEGVVIDERGGPVLVEKGARVEAPAKIRGPAYIGRGVKVVALSRVSAPSVEGPGVVEGVLEECILEAYCTVRGAYLRRLIAARNSLMLPFSAAWGRGARIVGMFSRLMPSSALINESRTGVGSKLYDKLEGELRGLAELRGGQERKLSLESVVRDLRSYLYAEFGRLPSDFEIKVMELSAR